jgi:hypothetical protein
MDLAQCLEEAYSALDKGQSKTAFIAAMAEKAEKYKVNPAYKTVQKQYQDMAATSYETAVAKREE